MVTAYCPILCVETLKFVKQDYSNILSIYFGGEDFLDVIQELSFHNANVLTLSLHLAELIEVALRLFVLDRFTHSFSSNKGAEVNPQRLKYITGHTYCVA